MIAKISVEQTTILNEMLLCPYSLRYLADNGRQPSDPGVRGAHADGCGMAFTTGTTVEVHKRSRENAWDQSYRELVLSAASNIFIAHNRLASPGLNLSEGNAHPFSITAAGKTFALCHNGGVRSYMEEARKNQSSDSYIFLQQLVDPSGKNDPGSVYSRLSAIAANTEYSSLCACMISNDELFAWRIYSERDPAKVADYEKYYTVYMIFRDNTAVFSSEPLDEAPWMLLQNKSFLHLKVKGTSLVLDYHLL